VPNNKVYIHEFIDVIGQNRAKYMHHITANWSPIAQEERNQLCYGVWGTIGTTGRWPEVVNLWEEPGWPGLAENLARETQHPSLQDPSLAAWWADAANLRRGGIDRVMIPAPWTRTIEELCADGVRGVFYAHELVKLEPGASPRFLELVRDQGVPVYQELGLELVGAFRTAMRNDSEALLLWAIVSPDAWARFEVMWHAVLERNRLTELRRSTADVVLDLERTLLVDSPLCPLRTGRQPRASDRTPRDRV
jgi:hypothetical protein